jgi:cell filamentation protein
VQEHYLDRIDTETEFTAELICRMHHDWLGEIYPWAGQYRTVEMSKDGFTWPPAHRVPANMAQFEAVILGYECNYSALAAFFREALARATNA